MFRIRHFCVLLVLAILPTCLISNGHAQCIVAHRGASHDAPENTLAAFRLAWEKNADAIEADFYLSRDGHIVCIHDKTTERTAGVELTVAESSLADLKQLDVGSWKHKRFAGEKIPTLQEVIATIPKGKRIVIELKVGPEIVAPLQRILSESKLKPEQIMVISFKESTIAESKRAMPNIKAHWLTGYDPDDEIGPWTPTAASVIRTVERTNADGFGSHARRGVFNQKFIDTLTDAGVREFHVWTIDDPADARFYINLGAIGITTNRPAFIRSHLGK